MASLDSSGTQAHKIRALIQKSSLRITSSGLAVGEASPITNIQIESMEGFLPRRTKSDAGVVSRVFPIGLRQLNSLPKLYYLAYR